MTESPEHIAEVRIAEALKTGAAELNLEDLGLSALPEAIWQLTALQSLSLAGNQLRALPEAIGRLTALQSLDLSNNKLSALPEAVGRLTALLSLSLSYNKLSALPEAVGRLTVLQSLSLFSNQLGTVPEEIWQLTALRSLELSDNQLSALPEAIGQLTALQQLGLWVNQLRALPAAIGKLTALQSLGLGGNQLSALPEEIGQLTALGALFLWGNKLSALPEAVGRLTALQSLSLAGNQLSALPEAIGKLTALLSLDLSSNRLSALPEAIGKLTALQSLDLSSNRLSALPEAVGQLTALRILYLHGNSGLRLPPDVLGPQSDEVGRDNKQPAAPADILTFYFRSRSEATRPLHLAKILIVGQAAVGKTSLVRMLKGKSFDEHERITEGISIADWSVPLEADSRDDEVKVKIWDFGGQEVMHATHQFFLTKRSLYLVVLDARRGEDDCRLHYWLKIVESYGGGSPVIVVINKCEPPHWLELNERRLRTDYPSIRQFLKVSCAIGLGIGELRQLVETQVRELPHVADAVPTSFFDLKRDLECRTNDYLTFAEYQEACRAHGIESQQDQESFLRILHALGSMLNYDDPESPYALRDTNVLKPEWVIEGVYQIINSNTLMKVGGVLERKDLGNILSDHVRFPPDRHRFIIEMMRKFELCFDFPDAPDRLLIPDLLSPNEPDLNWPPAREALNLEYHYNVLPSSLLSRFIVRMHHCISKRTYWRSGVVLDIEGNKALVRADEKAPRIYVSIVGPEATRRGALSAIRNEFRAIHGSISALEAQEKVPLPEDPTTLLDYEELLALERDGFEYIPRKLSDGTTRRVNVKQLLDGVTPPEARANEQRVDESAFRRGDSLRSARGGHMRQVPVEPAPFEPAPLPHPEAQPMQARHGRQEQQQTWEKIAIFAIGVAFVATLIAIALWVPDPTQFQIFIFRVVLALGAGALGALIPGFIEVKFRNFLRAGGAIALFVIVYLINPPELITEAAGTPDAPATAAEGEVAPGSGPAEQ